MTTLPHPRVAAVDAPPPKSRPGRPEATPPAPRQTWTQTRRRLLLSMEDLRRTVIERCEAHPDRVRLIVALDEAIVDLEALLDDFDRPLTELLDAVRRAPDPECLRQAQRRAGAHVAQGRERFAADELVELMDTNGFVELGLRASLDVALAEIARQLGGAPEPAFTSERYRP